MRLLIVVDKLLTGFDAPPCTYLYIDKSMQDHGLFQAICRTNRLDGEDKQFGYIVDYKDLFKKVQGAMSVYTSELDDGDGGASPEVLLQDRLKAGRERLEEAREAIALLCEPVDPPKGMLEHIHFFCGNTEIPEDLQEREPRRTALYKGTAALVRAFANIADDLAQAGYSNTEIVRLKQEVNDTLKLRDAIRQSSGETIDLKSYEADMRHLIDTYIQADAASPISDFGETGLVELIVKSGIADAVNTLSQGIRDNPVAIAETIANNVRSTIVKDHLNDPAFYDKMSALLNEIIADLRAQRINYQEFLKRVAQLAKKLVAGQEHDTPEQISTRGLRALYSNLGQDKELAVKIDEAVKKVRPADWRSTQAKRLVVKQTLWNILQNADEVERIFRIIERHEEY
jgi:type I restriction enzyme R subunit